MATRQYIGARYVIKVYENSEVAGSAEWEANTVYEPLVLVTYQNGSYLSKKYVPSTVGNPATNTDYWVQTGFYNGQIANLQHQIDIINDALANLEDDFETLEDRVNETIEAINAKVKNIKVGRVLAGNLLMNDNYDFTVGGAPNGSCYIGNDRIIVYLSDFTNSNVGKLRCYNLSTYTIAWEHSITAYHGNSITYNPNNNHIYICGCIDNTTSAAINSIIEIDLDNPGVIIREFSLPAVTSCYSLTYDKDANEFYAVAYTGTTAGTADMLYVFNGSLTEVVRSVQLEDYPAVTYKLSTQGAQLALDGVVYIPTYSPTFRAIYGYNPVTGKIVSISSIPDIINDCRSVGEIQSIVYDYDNDRFIVGSCLYVTGTYKYYSNMYFEVDMFKGIPMFKPDPANTTFDIPMYGNIEYCICAMAGNSLKPSWLIDTNFFTVPNDAIIYAKRKGIAVEIQFVHSHRGVSEQGGVLTSLALSGFNGKLTGYPDGLVKIKEFNVIGQGTISVLRAELKGYELTLLADGFYGNTFLKGLCRVFFQSCKFASYEATGNNKYHIVAYNGATAYSYNNMFEGAVTNDTLTAILGEVVTQ